MIHAIDPFVMVLLDNQEHHFYYNAMVAKRAAKALRQDDVTGSGLEVLIGMFYYADETIDREQMTLDQYSEIMPGDMEALKEKFDEMKAAHGFQRPPKVVAPSPAVTTG
jgi:hypothetical protein